MKKQYKATTLSPIHIGSINNWSADLNFQKFKDKTPIYRLESFPIDLEKDAVTGKELQESFLSCDLSQISPLSVFPSKVYSNEISPFAKNYWGHPYIPGNSLKGFFNSSEKYTADKPENQKILFPDIEFPYSALQVSEIKILNLTSDRSYGWRKFGVDNRTIPDPKNATSHYIEILKPGETSLCEIKFSTGCENMETLINNYSKQIIKNELEFYNKCNMKEGYLFYSSLNEKINRIQTGFFICIGWGIGWKAIAGGLHQEKNMSYIRRHYDIGKTEKPCPACKKPLKNDRFKQDLFFCINCKKSFSSDSIVIQMFPVFPKTRKFVFESGKPFLPLGWLKFEQSDNYQMIRNKETSQLEIQVKQKSSKIIRPKFYSSEEYPEIKAQSSHFKKKIKIQNRGNFPTEFNMFLNKIAQYEFIISINGEDINPQLDTMQSIITEKYDELIFHFSNSGKGIALTIKSGAKNENQRNFVINKIWETVDSLQKP